MTTDVSPEILMNAVLADIKDTLLTGDGVVLPKSDDHYLAFISPGYPMLGTSFDYALEGFGGVRRANANPAKLDEALGPHDLPEEEQAPPPEDDQAAALAADASRKYMNAESFAALCDLIPDTSGIVDSGRINVWNPEQRLSHSYALALRFSQVYNVEPDAETTRKLERWRSLLQTTRIEKDPVTEEDVERTEESALVKAYHQKSLVYYGEQLAYNNARIAALAARHQEDVHRFAVNGPLMQLRLRAAHNDWVSNGYKDTYDRINAAIEAVGDRSIALLKQRYKEDFFRSLLTNPVSGANFPFTMPAPADFARSDAGWSEFTFRAGSFDSKRKFTTSESSVRASFSLFGVKLGPSGETQKSHLDTKIDSKNFFMKFKICRATIYRPFFNLSFLKSGFWRFDQQNQEYKNTLLSDGKTPPNGLLPAFTTDCVFVKDLVINFGKRHSETVQNIKNMQGRAGMSFGPFPLGGRFSGGKSSTETEFHTDHTSEGLAIEGMQLIGFLCHTLDKCPDPNPKITNWL